MGDGKMKKKEKNCSQTVDFSEQTPDIQIDNEDHDRLYEKVFLSREATDDSEYTRNTTTWD